MTLTQLTPHHFEDITNNENTNHSHTIHTLTKDSLKDYFIKYTTCLQWESPYLYSVSEHDLEIQLDILSAVIDHFVFWNYSLDHIGHYQVELVLDRHQHILFSFTPLEITQHSQISRTSFPALPYCTYFI